GELLGCASAVREQEPTPRLGTSREHPPGGARLESRRARHKYRLPRAARRANVRHRTDLGEAGVREQPAPARAREERVMGAELAVPETPPAGRQAEHQINPACRPVDLQRDEDTLRGEKLAHVDERLVEAGGGVQRVAGDHDIEGVRLKSLLAGFPLDVEQLAAETAMVEEALLRSRKE